MIEADSVCGHTRASNAGSKHSLEIDKILTHAGGDTREYIITRVVGTIQLLFCNPSISVMRLPYCDDQFDGTQRVSILYVFTS